MVRITEDLLRKSAEHNECMITTLEEVSLHQRDIEKIENLDKWCRQLRILYLQSNLISRIENVSRLKYLEYLNLALNNIERIENLEGCESLKKLDLTVNFIGELSSINCLKNLSHFETFYMIGNPCTDFVGYRKYVLSVLPQLKSLDGQEIEKSERIQAYQNFYEVQDDIMRQECNYQKKRQKERDGLEDDKIDDDKDAKYDNNISEDKIPFTPETRIQIHKEMEESRKKESPIEEKKPKQRRYIADDGRALNVNEPKVDFKFIDKDNEKLLLDVAIFKHLDTSYLEIDMQPLHVKILIKGKVLQLVLPEEISPDKSSASRSLTSGHLVLTMIKMNYIPKTNKKCFKASSNTCVDEDKSPTHQLLEVDPSSRSCVDINNIVKKDSEGNVIPLDDCRNSIVNTKSNSSHFCDDPSVPPLI